MLGGRTGGWGLVPSVLVPVRYANIVVSLSPVVSVGPMVSVGPVVSVGHVVLLCVTTWLEDDLNGKVGFIELCLAGFGEVKISAKKMVWMLKYSFFFFFVEHSRISKDLHISF